MTDTPSLPLWAKPYVVAELAQKRATRFVLEPESDIRAAICAELSLQKLRKLRFSGEIQASGKSDWTLRGRLGATVVQACVITLAPVITRIEQDVALRYVSTLSEPEEGSEIEMPEDDSVEPLGTLIDPGLVMVEVLALFVPQFPRAPDAKLGETTFSSPGVAPMSDADARPFAALKSLQQKPPQNPGDETP